MAQHEPAFARPEIDLEALERFAQALVGTGHVWEAQERLARGMLMEALRRTAANYTHAARLLGVKRQAIQQMVTRFDLVDWTLHLRVQTRSTPS